MYRFLLIDDDESCNVLNKIIIQKVFADAHIVSFTSPEEALAFIRADYVTQAMPTVLLLDINMPGLSGWEVLEIFNTFPENIRTCFSIYILSSSIDPADKLKADAETLVKSHVVKPLTKQFLLNSFLAQ